MIFAEALTTLDEYRQFTSVVKVPVLANITEFGKTPLFTVEELAGAGAQLVLYPLSAFRAMSKAAENVYGSLRREGTQKSVLGLMQTRVELYEVLGYHEYEQKLDALFAREAARHLIAKTHESHTMSSETPSATGFKPKKSVALSGVTAGNTALCTVGRTGNDLAYRGYDILDIADQRRIRGSGAPAGPRQAAEPRGTARIQGKAETPARTADAGAGRAGGAAGVESPDGRVAHGHVGARLRAARKRRSQHGRRA